MAVPGQQNVAAGSTPSVAAGSYAVVLCVDCGPPVDSKGNTYSLYGTFGHTKVYTSILDNALTGGDTITASGIIDSNQLRAFFIGGVDADVPVDGIFSQSGAYSGNTPQTVTIVATPTVSTQDTLFLAVDTYNHISPLFPNNYDASGGGFGLSGGAGNYPNSVTGYLATSSAGAARTHTAQLNSSGITSQFNWDIIIFMFRGAGTGPPVDPSVNSSVNGKNIMRRHPLYGEAWFVGNAFPGAPATNRELVASKDGSAPRSHPVWSIPSSAPGVTGFSFSFRETGRQDVFYTVGGTCKFASGEANTIDFATAMIISSANWGLVSHVFDKQSGIFHTMLYKTADSKWYYMRIPQNPATGLPNPAGVVPVQVIAASQSYAELRLEDDGTLTFSYIAGGVAGLIRNRKGGNGAWS